jgi:hypothetical protein
VETFPSKVIFQVETMAAVDYRTAVEAAHVQFAMSLLTPALRNYIWRCGEDVDDVDDKDFVECCRFIVGKDLVQHRHVCFFKDAIDLRKDVSHQNLQSSDENIKSLIRIATCIRREDLAHSIDEFSVSRKRFRAEDNGFVRPPASAQTNSASVAPVNLRPNLPPNFPNVNYRPYYQPGNFPSMCFSPPYFQYANWPVNGPSHFYPLPWY